jgi:membrane-bound lytic murein transglycosylase D
MAMAKRHITLVIAFALIAPGARGEENLAERRAVRGVPVDDAVGESPELRELRRFEEESFPRGGVRHGAAETDSALPPPLPGTWGGSGDVPPELRAAEPARSEPGAPPDSEWLRSLKLPDVPVRWEPQVLRYLDYFKNDPKGRAVMANWLRRAARYRDLFEAAFAREGLPRDLICVAMVESSFDNSARSRTGAGGIWQFMPGAARAYGLEVSYWVDARRDPERAVEASARYMKDLYVRFGSWYLVFAAYNAGYGAVLRSITSYNTNDYWELIRHESGLPWESSVYVPKILAAMIVSRNVAAFGFADLTLDAPFAYEEVSVAPGTTLATVARAADTKTEVIEALNPHLARGRTPPDRPATLVRVPPGTAALYAANIEASRTASDRLEIVTLRFGETLDDVARGHGTTARELKRLNSVRDTGELRAGVAIVVPKRGGAGSGADAAKAAAKPAPAEAADATAAATPEPEDSVIVAVPERAFSYEGRERVFYRTRDADSLDEIADAFGVRNEDLVEWNNLDAGAKLHPRMVLQIFVRKDFDPSSVMLLDSSKVRVVTLGSDEFLELETARRGKKRLYYTCKSGDTLAKLGRRYGLTPGDLARINRFSYNTELHEGDRVVVYSPTGDAPREVTMGLTPGKSRPERSSRASASGRAANAASKTVAVAKPSAATGKKTPPPAPRPGAPATKPGASGKPPGAKSADAGKTSGKPGTKPTEKAAAKKDPTIARSDRAAKPAAKPQ